MAEIRISIGRPYEVVHEDRYEATVRYAHYLETLGHDVELEVIEYQPGKRGLGLVEVTLIYIALKAADEAIGAITHDVYESAKKFIRLRREARKRATGGIGRHFGFTIYGPDGKPLASWDTREDDPMPSSSSRSDEGEEAYEEDEE